MNDLDFLIDELARMPAPDRNADKTIGYAIGMQEMKSPAGVYYALGSKTFHHVPAFTSSVDAALIVLETAPPVQSYGFTFGPGPRAVINDGEPWEGATPAIALCIAALRRKQQTD
ncbi:hypothetical protein I6F15_11675 [Bradyrhizobium sp. BRP14]|nr:hypothetical protein [Bradyrhizobium sp. BRP14]